MSKVIDTREGDGELVVLGRAVVLPTDVSETTVQPLDGSIRFNPSTNAVEVYASNGWFPLGLDPEGNYPLQSLTIAQITGLQTALNGKATTTHTHSIAQVVGLQSTLNGKAAVGHTHVMSDVTGLSDAIAALQSTQAAIQASVTGVTSGKANTIHSHVVADTIGLQALLDQKTGVGHSHTTDAIVDLEARLALLTREEVTLPVVQYVLVGRIHRRSFTFKVRFPHHFFGSIVKWEGNLNGTGNLVLEIRQNGVAVGYITLTDTNPVTYAITTISTQGVLIAANDYLEVVSPRQVSSLTNFSFTLVGDRSLT